MAAWTCRKRGRHRLNMQIKEELEPIVVKDNVKNKDRAKTMTVTEIEQMAKIRQHSV